MVPVNLLRNTRHDATPRISPFDDLMVSTLSSLFHQFREEYNIDKSKVAKALYEVVVKHAEHNCSYTAEKSALKYHCVQPGAEDVEELLEHFDSLDSSQLLPFDRKYCEAVWQHLCTHGCGLEHNNLGIIFDDLQSPCSFVQAKIFSTHGCEASNIHVSKPWNDAAIPRYLSKS